VIDNCEHVVQASAEVVEKLLSASSELRVLATSREALRVSGEFAWRVPSLPIPEIGERVDAKQLMEYAATRLLMDWIHQTEPEFPMSGSDAVAAVKVCSSLNGIPLAIELAAARAASMSLQDIALRLDDRFKPLTGGTRTAVERQRTLRATIDWSHALLSPTDRTLFRRLASFAGGWTLDAGESVCADEGLPSSGILEVLTRLIDQSLVNVQVHEAGPAIDSWRPCVPMPQSNYARPAKPQRCKRATATGASPLRNEHSTAWRDQNSSRGSNW
jgi:predicted ATPase